MNSGDYYRVRCDAPLQNAKIFYKGILINDARISLPYSIIGITICDAVINLNSQQFGLDISRRRIDSESKDKLNSAIGFALYSSISNHEAFTHNERSIILDFLNKYYYDCNSEL